jgi:hypothetical protein
MNASEVQVLIQELSSGKRSKDPHAPVLERPKRFVPEIVQPVKICSRIGNVKWAKYQINLGAKFGIGIEGAKKIHSFLQDMRYHKTKKKWGMV